MTPRNIAHRGLATFYVERDFWASSANHQTDTSVVKKVPMRMLDEEIRRIKPTFLILDIEGGEYDLIWILNDFQTIRKVSIELHQDIIGPEKIDFIKQRLADAGFAIDPRFTVGWQLFASRPSAMPGTGHESPAETSESRAGSLKN